MVVVTEYDAEALDQEPGTTSTVLLTAYPRGHGGNEPCSPDASQQCAVDDVMAKSLGFAIAQEHTNMVQNVT